MDLETFLKLPGKMASRGVNSRTTHPVSLQESIAFARHNQKRSGIKVPPAGKKPQGS